MSWLPDPIWPVVALAVIQFADALMCLRPLPFIAKCFEDVGLPRRYWWMLPPVKFAASAGLIAGIWIPFLGVVTCTALVAFFITAVSMHIAAKDFGRNLFLNATGMLVICVATDLYCFAL